MKRTIIMDHKIIFKKNKKIDTECSPLKSSHRDNFLQEYLFLDISRRLYVFTEQMLIFQEVRRAYYIFPGRYQRDTGSAFFKPFSNTKEQIGNFQEGTPLRTDI